jgi:hypothetical protein
MDFAADSSYVEVVYNTGETPMTTFDLTTKPITKEEVAKRHRIERIWRKVNGVTESTELAMSDEEWAFLVALLDASPE